MAVTAPMTQAQIDAELQRKKNLGIAPTSAGNQAAYDKLVPQSPTVPNTPGAAIGAVIGSKIPLPTTAPMIGPTLDGSRPQVVVPNVATPTPVPTPSGDGRLQGPYPTPSGGVQQGVNVVNNQMQYDQPTVPTPAVPPVPTVNSQSNSPTAPNLYQDKYAKSPEDIAKLAADRIAKILAAARTARDGALAGTKNAYDYTNQIQGDSRQLRNASLKDSSNPFGGALNFQQAQNNRNDSLQDTAEDKDYNAAVGQINQKLADLEAAAPGDEQAIIDQLQQIERQTGISVAQLQEQQKQNQFNNGIAAGNLTGTYNGTQTLAAKSQEQNYGLDLANLSGQLPGGGQTLQSKNMEFDQGVAQAGLTGMYNGQQTLQSKQLDRNNFESDRSYNLAKATQDWTQTFQKEQYTDQKAQQLWDNSFKDKSFAQSMSDAAASRGLQWASLNQRDKEYIADSAFREKSFNADQEQRKIDNLKSGGSDALNKEIDGLYAGLTSGAITGSAAIEEIDGKVRAGILNKTDADRMKSVITTVTTSQPNIRPKLTQDQIDSNGGNNPQDLNSAQLEKLWKTDPTGQAAGRPSLDWASWYTDPRGRVGGISFESWRSAYGPQIKGK